MKRKKIQRMKRVIQGIKRKSRKQQLLKTIKKHLVLLFHHLVVAVRVIVEIKEMKNAIMVGLVLVLIIMMIVNVMELVFRKRMDKINK